MYITIFGIILSLISAIYLNPLVRIFGDRYNLRDSFDSRKHHKYNLVRVGGITLLTSFLISSTISYFLKGINFLNVEYINLIIGTTFFFFIGFSDDLLSRGPIKKLFLQILISSILTFKGLNIPAAEIINQTYMFNLNENFISIFDTLVTIIWITGVTNAINWEDGLDGLAGGIIAVSSFSYMVLFLSSGNIQFSIICGCILGSCLGYLKDNFYPAKIIMGDCGSYFLGSFIAIISIIYFKNSENYSFNNILILFLILFLPLFDMVRVILVRLIKNRSPFKPDRSHLHQYLLDIGLSQRSTVIYIYLICFFFSSIAFYVSNIKFKDQILLLSTIILFLSTLKIFKWKRLAKK